MVQPKAPPFEVDVRVPVRLDAQGHHLPEGAHEAQGELSTEAVAMDELLAGLGQFGLPGIVIAALGWAYWQQSLALKASQESRVEDAKKVSQLVIDLIEKQHDETAEIKELLRSNADALRRIEAGK